MELISALPSYTSKYASSRSAGTSSDTKWEEPDTVYLKDRKPFSKVETGSSFFSTYGYTNRLKDTVAEKVRDYYYYKDEIKVCWPSGTSLDLSKQGDTPVVVAAVLKERSYPSYGRCYFSSHYLLFSISILLYLLLSIHLCKILRLRKEHKAKFLCFCHVNCKELTRKKLIQCS